MTADERPHSRCIEHTHHGDPVTLTTGHHPGTGEELATLAVGSVELDLNELPCWLRDGLLGVLDERKAA